MERSLARYTQRLQERASPVYRHAVISELTFDERLSQQLGRSVWLKAEHQQPGGSYKIRPAAASLASLSPAQRARGVIAASGGNFAVSVALAATREGIPLTLVMPEDAYIEKQRFLPTHPDLQVLFGDAPGYDSAEEKAKQLSLEQSRPFLSPTEGESVYLGNATIALELIEQAPNLSAIVAGVGGGGLCLGLSWVASPLGISVIGASPAAASAMHQSLLQRRAVLQYDGEETWAEPLSGGVPQQNFERAQRAFTVSLVSEDEVRQAMRDLYQSHSFFIEAAGAVAYALVSSGRAPLPNNGDIAIVLSGGNLSEERKRWVQEK
jgi:threonine dehydratase